VSRRRPEVDLVEVILGQEKLVPAMIGNGDCAVHPRP
jgi:hypothetical protein